MQDGGSPGDEAVRWGKELGKGATRLALLRLLERDESYGYEIVASLQKQGLRVVGATEAAIYPHLKDLEAKGYLRANWRATEPGVPPRKYYRLTAAGAELLVGMRREARLCIKEIRVLLEREDERS